MIILTGYYQFGGIKTLQNKTVTLDRSMRATDEVNAWSAKLRIKGRSFVLREAVGVLSDKFGFWYILNFKMTKSRLSFTSINENSREQYDFVLTRIAEQPEFLGVATSIHLTPGDIRLVNCLALETPEITPDISGVSERMLLPPPPQVFH